MAAGLRILSVTLLCCLSQPAAAELPDPTRPAIDLSSGGGSGGVAATSADAPEEVAQRGLQTVIISPQYRAAIINGETVRLGENYGEAKLVEVRENSVVLQNAQGRRVLELFPRVGMKKSAAQKNDREQENGSGPQGLPEKAAGGIK